MTPNHQQPQRPGAAHIFEGYLDEEDYRKQRGISRRTAQRERKLRVGPPHVLIGSKVYYRIEAVRAWLLRREVSCDADCNSRALSTRTLARGR